LARSPGQWLGRIKEATSHCLLWSSGGGAGSGRSFRQLCDKRSRIKPDWAVSAERLPFKQVLGRKIEDRVAERVEFELPVPICERSDDSIKLALRHRDELQNRYRPAAHF
jgi:hypothetical protein